MLLSKKYHILLPNFPLGGMNKYLFNIGRPPKTDQRNDSTHGQLGKQQTYGITYRSAGG